MSDPLIIRPIQTQDAADWRRLWAGYLEFYESTVPEEVYHATFARLIDPDNTRQCGALALKGGTPVGLVHWITHPHNWKLEDVIYLQDLFADPGVRGAGIGRALIEHVYQVADQSGTPTVYWMTQEFNTTARRLYDRIANKTVFVQYKR